MTRDESNYFFLQHFVVNPDVFPQDILQGLIHAAQFALEPDSKCLQHQQRGIEWSSLWRAEINHPSRPTALASAAVDFVGDFLLAYNPGLNNHSYWLRCKSLAYRQDFLARLKLACCAQLTHRGCADLQPA